MGLCCKVKLPGPLLQQPEEEGGERQDGGSSGVFIHQPPCPPRSGRLRGRKDCASRVCIGGHRAARLSRAPASRLVADSILLGGSSPRGTESNSFLQIPWASLAPTSLLSEVACLISGSDIQDRGGKKVEVIMCLSLGNVLSNSASPPLAPLL